MGKIFVFCCIIVVILLLVYYWGFSEGFEDNDTRAEKIVSNTKDLFNNGNFDYSSFKSQMGGSTNVVEYNAAKQAHSSGNFNKDNIVKLL